MSGQRVIVKVLAAFCALWSSLGSIAVAQVGDGPRAYQTLPKDTRVLSQFYIGTRGNLTPASGIIPRDAELDMDLGITQFSQTLEINGRQAGALAYIPYGDISGSLALGGTSRSASTSGFSDLTVGIAYGLLNTPSLAFEDYVKFDPGISIAGLAKLTLPTGSYNGSKALNMGGNRFALELGLPVAYYLGSSFLDPTLTSFEILPKVTLFGENDEPSGGGGELEQDPLLTIEAHLTRNFGQAFWLSLDAFYSYGGETATDGEEADNKQRSLSLGGTGSLNLSRSTSLKVTYGEVVSGNADGADGHLVRVQLLYLF